VSRVSGRLKAVAAAVVVLAVLVVAGIVWSTRSGDDPATLGPGASGPSPTVSADEASREFSAKYLTALPAVTPIASQQGSIEVTNTEKTPATMDVLSLESNDASTVLRWRLSTPQQVAINSPQFSARRSNSSTSALTLVSTATDQRLTLGEYVQVGFTACTCSDLPYESGPGGVELSAVFGPLDAGATQVELNVPGFAPLTVPVTRR
jgi:hypothetical protein